VSQLKYWDGAKWSVVEVGAQGLQGPIGTPGAQGVQGIQGSYTNVGNTPPSNPTYGSIFTSLTTGGMFIWDGLEWFQISGNLTGAQGPSGLQGPQGTAVSIAPTYDTDQGVISGQVFN
jgi:hypothetical protein